MKIATVFFLLLACLASGSVLAQGKVIPVAQYYEGGQEALLRTIRESIEYPPVAKRARIAGECIIAFVLEADGSITQQRVIKNIGGGCGDEAMRVVKNLRFKAPGYRQDASVPVRFVLSPIKPQN